MPSLNCKASMWSQLSGKKIIQSGCMVVIMPRGVVGYGTADCVFICVCVYCQ